MRRLHARTRNEVAMTDARGTDMIAKKSKHQQARERAVASGNAQIMEARRLLHAALCNSRTARDSYAEGALVATIQVLHGVTTIQLGKA